MNQSSFHQLQMGLIGVLGFRFLCRFLGVLPAHDWMNVSDLSHFLFCFWNLLVESGEDSRSCLNVLPPYFLSTPGDIYAAADTLFICVKQELKIKISNHQITKRRLIPLL